MFESFVALNYLRNQDFRPITPLKTLRQCHHAALCQSVAPQLKEIRVKAHTSKAKVHKLSVGYCNAYIQAPAGHQLMQTAELGGRSTGSVLHGFSLLS